MKWKAKFVLAAALAAFIGTAFAYTGAEHKKNMGNKEYAAAFTKMEEALKKAKDELPPELAGVIVKEQEAWFAGFGDDFEGAEENIDLKSNQFMEFGGFGEQKAYTAAVAGRVAEIEERFLVCWLMANPDGLQGLYLLEAEDGVSSVLTVRALSQGEDGVYEFDVRLRLEADMEEGTAVRVFHNAARFVDRRMPLYDVDEDDSKPIYVEMWLGDPFQDAMEVIVDDAFKTWEKELTYRLYSGFTIEGVYHRKTFP